MRIGRDIGGTWAGCGRDELSGLGVMRAWDEQGWRGREVGGATVWAVMYVGGGGALQVWACKLG